LSKDLKKVFQDKNGSCADINLLLVAACKKMGLNAEPAILSTRDNGKVEESYPLISQYNYVICHLKIDDVEYNLDATDKMLAFGQLPLKVYNGSARVIANPPILVSLSTDSLKESKMTSVFIINDSDGKSITGTINSNLGNDESKYMRSKMQKESIDDYFKEIKKSYSMEVEMSNTEVDSLKLLENPISIKYDIKVPTNDEDIIYFNPVLQKTFSENPFKAAERFFPVEMDHCIDDIYILNMQIPKGYKVEEKPKSARVMLNENEGMFEYLIAENGSNIQLRCRTTIKKANFEPEDYQTLRDFFAFIVSKENEQIVFKKQ